MPTMMRFMWRLLDTHLNAAARRPLQVRQAIHADMLLQRGARRSRGESAHTLVASALVNQPLLIVAAIPLEADHERVLVPVLRPVENAVPVMVVDGHVPA